MDNMRVYFLAAIGQDGGSFLYVPFPHVMWCHTPVRSECG